MGIYGEENDCVSAGWQRASSRRCSGARTGDTSSPEPSANATKRRSIYTASSPRKTRTMEKGKGSKQKILEFFLANIGRVIDARELQEASGWAAEWARRVRKLRDEQGYQILSHKDRADLKPGQYLLETDKRRPAFARGISKETKAFVLPRNGNTCQMCGAAAGDPDPFNPVRTIRLTIGHFKYK